MWRQEEQLEGYYYKLGKLRLKEGGGFEKTELASNRLYVEKKGKKKTRFPLWAVEWTLILSTK